jgi:secondary thiamine-phosphate synthase enzyme
VTLRQLHDTLALRTRGRGLHDLTEKVQDLVRASSITEGACTLAILHTSASLLVHENADDDVKLDLETFLARLCPEGPRLYRHDAEGPDDMPAHLRAAILPSSLTIPILGGRLRLGTWQGVSLYEHRTAPHDRRVAVHAWGDS